MPQQRNGTGAPGARRPAAAGVPADAAPSRRSRWWGGPGCWAGSTTGPPGPVTLVRGPRRLGQDDAAHLLGAGGGRGRRPAWVQVEAGDSGDRLWAYLAAALRGGSSGHRTDRPPCRRSPAAARPAGGARRRPRRPGAAGPLVLDDLHRVTDPAVLTGLEFLLRHADGGCA